MQWNEIRLFKEAAARTGTKWYKAVSRWLATGVGAGEDAEDLGVAGGVEAESGAMVLVGRFHFS